MPKPKRMKKVYVIFVALDFENFEHYCTEPQIFYDTYEEADVQMNHLIQTKAFEETQLKIKTLWKIIENT